MYKRQEQTLGELEVRLKEMAQVVMAGRQELVKIQTIRTHEEVNGSTETNTVPITRARRGSGRVRSVKRTG